MAKANIANQKRALCFLAKKKEFEKTITTKEDALRNLENLLLSIQQAQTDQEVKRKEMEKEIGN